MKILDFDLEGSHFIIEADISPRQEADDDMECQWLRYDFDNTQVYKETDGAVSPFQITAVAWAGYQLTADHALKDVIGRISRNETGKLTVHYVCPELQEFFDELKKKSGYQRGKNDSVLHFSRRRYCKTGVCDQ